MGSCGAIGDITLEKGAENVPTLEYVGAGSPVFDKFKGTDPVEKGCMLVAGDDPLIHGFPLRASCSAKFTCMGSLTCQCVISTIVADLTSPADITIASHLFSDASVTH